MEILALLYLALKRLRSRIGVSLVLLGSIALTTGILVCVPVFASAVSRKMMQQETEARTEWTHRPPFSVRFYAVPTDEHPMTLADIAYTRDWLANMLVRRVGLPIAATYIQNESPWFEIVPTTDNTHYTATSLGKARVVCATDIGQHIRIVEGSPYGDSDARQMLAWVFPSLAEERGLQVGERYALQVDTVEGIFSVPMVIAGLWEAVDPEERYWYQSPYGLMGRQLLITSEQYETFIAPLFEKRSDFAFWYFVFDDSKLDLDRAQRYIEGLKSVELEVARRLPRGTMDYAPLEELERGQRRKNVLSMILLTFSMPLVSILIFFVASVSAIIARFQMKEMTMFASRGGSRAQIVSLALAETTILLAIACPLGAILVAPTLARVLGYTESFLIFTNKPPLDVRLAAADWRYVSIVLIACVPARLIPAWLAAGSSVVCSECEAARRHNALGGMQLAALGRVHPKF